MNLVQNCQKKNKYNEILDLRKKIEEEGSLSACKTHHHQINTANSALPSNQMDISSCLNIPVTTLLRSILQASAQLC